MADEKTYTCSLDQYSLQKAKKELHEDPKETPGVLKTFRDWIHQQNWLKTPTGMPYDCLIYFFTWTDALLSFRLLLTLSQTTNFRLFQTERVCRRQFQIC